MTQEQIQEIRYLVGEAWKGAYNPTTVYGNANVVQDTEGLSVYRSLKPGNSGHPLTDQQWWFKIIDMSSIKALYDQMVEGNNTMAENELGRVAAEQSRVSAEQSRVNAETVRIYNENQRINDETTRVRAEQDRVTQENQRISQEQGRVGAEQQRVTKEQQRVNQEASRVAAETQRQLNENDRQAVFAEDHAVAVADHQQAEQDHTRAESDHETAVSDHGQMTALVERADADHVQAGNDHTRAESDHTTAANDHTQAGQDHTRAESDHTQAGNDHTRAESDHTASAAATEAANTAAAGANALQQNLENGVVVPALAGNLESWEDKNVPVENNFDAVIRTTAGDDPINSDDGGVVKSIVPVTDFKCTGLLATAENQLRLKSDGGGAVAVGAGWYFPVPKLTLGTFGTTDENNGLLLVDNTGANIQNATVYFKALANGVPTSVTDGTQLTPQTVTYGDKTYKVYTTSGPGYLIVSGITYANTCARIAWEDWYDKFVSPTDPNDVGGSINLAPLFAAVPNGTGKFLVCGNAYTYGERISATQWKITDTIGRIASPAWTDTPDEVEEGETQTYTHTLIISDVAAGSTVMIEGSAQALSLNETTVSYTDTNATAITGAVRYEKAVAATATVNLASAYTLNDVGVEMKEGVEGTANFVCEYSQNIADSLAMAPPRLNDLRHTSAAVSLGYGICTTGTYDAAKTVNIPHFMLLDNGTINVLFTTPINTENATLNVSLTGAKPIRILGQNLPAGVIKAETYVTMAYDGVAWNITNIFCPDASFDPAALLVDMGLPSGVKWAARDIDLTKPGGFCETPFTYMKSFFSWGNIDGHNPSSVSAFDYNWGGVNQAEPWYDGQPYGSTPGNTLTGNIAVGEDFDAARANLGAPWRMPTSAEFAELFANIKYINADGTEVDTTKTDKRVTVNGVMGLYLESRINGARLFFACSGYGFGRSWYYRGSVGSYWSSTWYSARNARNLGFYSGGVYPQNYDFRYGGFALRPVQ